MHRLRPLFSGRQPFVTRIMNFRDREMWSLDDAAVLEHRQSIPKSTRFHGVFKGLLLHELRHNYTDPLSGVSYPAGTLLSTPVCHQQCFSRCMYIPMHHTWPPSPRHLLCTACSSSTALPLPCALEHCLSLVP